RGGSGRRARAGGRTREARDGGGRCRSGARGDRSERRSSRSGARKRFPESRRRGSSRARRRPFAGRGAGARRRCRSRSSGRSLRERERRGPFRTRSRECGEAARRGRGSPRSRGRPAPRPLFRRRGGSSRSRRGFPRGRARPGGYITRVARLLFVTGTPADVRGGSGTFVGISVLRRAVEALGHEVELLAPEHGRGRSLPGRLLFNLRARKAARGVRPDVVVGFDWDGIFLRRGAAPSVASLKGVLADEARFERGAPRIRLTTESFFEGVRSRSADRVLTTSRYSAAALARDYRIEEGRIPVSGDPIRHPPPS